jgi:hypothetical protein
VTAPRATSMDISGSEAGSTVRISCILAVPLAELNSPDVINVSGHRLSTAEIESALIMHKGVAETAGTFSSTFLVASV